MRAICSRRGWGMAAGLGKHPPVGRIHFLANHFDRQHEEIRHWHDHELTACATVDELPCKQGWGGVLAGPCSTPAGGGHRERMCGV